VTVAEAGIVLEARASEVASREFDLFVHEAGIEVVAVDAHQVDLVRNAHRKFGKGRHSASLNFGDCFVHSLATISGESVLAKGLEFKLAGLKTLA
jgi:ribonuclease VapC